VRAQQEQETWKQGLRDFYTTRLNAEREKREEAERRLGEALAVLKFYGEQGGATQSLWDYGERARAVLVTSPRRPTVRWGGARRGSYWFKVVCPSCLTEMHGQNVLLPRENGFRFSCLTCGWEASYYAADNVTYRFKRESIQYESGTKRVEIDLR